MESTPETTPPPTFFERLNIIVCFLWMLMNISLFVTAIIFKRNSYMIDLSYLNFDKLTVTLICIVGGFVLLYSLFLGLVYLITGKLLNPLIGKTKTFTDLGLFFGFSTYVFLIIFKMLSSPPENPGWIENYQSWIIRHWYLLLIPFSFITAIVLGEGDMKFLIRETGLNFRNILILLWGVISFMIGFSIIYWGVLGSIAWPFIMLIKYLVTRGENLPQVKVNFLSQKLFFLILD